MKTTHQKYLLYAGSFPVPLEVGGAPLDVTSTAHQSCHCSLHLNDTIKTSIIIIVTRSYHHKHHHHQEEKMEPPALPCSLDSPLQLLQLL